MSNMMINQIRSALREKQKINKKVDTIVIGVNSFVYLLDEVRQHRQSVGLFAADILGDRIQKALITKDFHQLQKLAEEMQFEGHKIQLINEDNTVVIP
jgi:hypothetical protein|tara:strand:- start:1743 stop:2036 length:294 start_codon:yes stop_codon:yes gene_type:complete